MEQRSLRLTFTIVIVLSSTFYQSDFLFQIKLYNRKTKYEFVSKTKIEIANAYISEQKFQVLNLIFGGSYNANTKARTQHI